MITVIKNVTVLTMDENMTVYENGFAAFDGNKIISVGSGEYTGKSDIVKDGRGGILMPGMINCHTHLPMIPFRSMGDDCADRLRRFLFPLENDAMTPELVYRRARYGALESLLDGVTTVTDMYYFEDRVAQACLDAGIRAFCGETIINQNTPDSENYDDVFAYTENFIEKWKDNDRIHPMVAPHSPDANTEDALKKAYDLSVKYGVNYTLHMSEMDYEMKYFREKYNCTPAQFLYKLGVMGKNTIFAHAIHIYDDDIKLIAESGAKIAHCIRANTKSGKGVCAVYDAINSGVTVGIGTDGPSSGNTLDILTQMRLIPLFQKTKYHNRSIMTAKEVVKMATINGAKTLGIENETGSIETGKKADLTLVSTESANMFPVYNPYSALVYSANCSDVDCVWADGELLVENHRLTKANLKDEKEKLLSSMGDFVAASKKYKDYI